MKPLTAARALTLTAVLLSLAAPAAAQLPTALDPVEIYADGFLDLRGVAVDANGNVFVADREAGTVTRIAPDRTQTIVASLLERPIGLAFDLTGRLLIAEERAGRVVRLEANGARTVLLTGVKHPRWLAVREDGTLYVSARRLTRDTDPEPDDESAEPEVILRLAPDGALSVLADGFRKLQALAVNHEALFAATQGRQNDVRTDGAIFRVALLADGSAGLVTPFGPADEFKKPVGLARDQLGALYVTTKELTLEEDRTKRAVAKLHPDGHVTAFAEQLAKPQGLALDASGNLYVADGPSGRVLRVRAPPAPTLTTPEFTNQNPLTVTGTTLAGARVDLFVNDATAPVTVVADATGAFSAAVTLAPNAPNTIDAFATSHGGDGLTSTAASATVTHDAIAPSLAFQAPPAGAHVRQSVTVQAQATDSGSQVATLGLTVDGQALSATVAPSLPAPSATATVTWNTLTVPDGTHTLGAGATDRASNTASAARVVTVDNTPPETTITDGPAGEIAVTTATFTFTGTDNLTPTASLLFAWRLDGGPWSAFSGATTASLTGLSETTHTFEVKARDLAGNEDLTPAAQTFTVRLGPAITAVAPASGTIGTFVTLTGAGFQPGSTTVTFNGLAAVVRTVTPTTLTTTVPIGATTGPLVVATSRGTASVPFTVTLTGDFTLTAAPATARVIAGDQTSISVTAGGTGSFTSLVSLSAAPTIAGIAPAFGSTFVAPGSGTFLTLGVSSTVAPGSYSFTVSGQADVDGQRVTRTAAFSLEVLAPETTAVTGRVLTAEAVPQPLPGVTISLGSAVTLTDSGGNFVLLSPPAGAAMLLVDGRTASTAEAQYPPVDVPVTATGPTRVPFIIYLPKLDTAHPIPLPTDATGTVMQDVQATTPMIPGLVVTIPAGTRILGPDGTPVSQITITPVPVDRAPMPLPAGLAPPMLFTIQPGGAVPSQPLPITFPNLSNAPAGTRADLYFFNLAAGDWSIWGQGTVDPDGVQVVPDPGAGQPRFAWGFFCDFFACFGGGDPAPPADNAPAATGGEPVDLFTGRFVVTKTDLMLPARIPITIARTAWSGLTRAGAFGLGWNLTPYDARLTAQGASLVLAQADQSRLLFVPAGPGRWINTTAPFLQGAVLTQRTFGFPFELRFKDGTVQRFDPLGNVATLAAITDRAGNTVTITREGATIPSFFGRITRITEPTGRAVTLTYDSANRIVAVTDPLGRVVTYAYDALGRLTTVTDPAGGVTTYAYDASHRITSITDARGITFIANEYDPTTGRVVRQTQADGGVWQFDYTLTGTTATQTVVTDPRGNATTHRFSPQGFTLSRTDALGQTTSFEYTPGTNLLATQTDPLGRVSRFEHDSLGNVTKIIDPAGNIQTFTYEPTFNRVATSTLPLDQITLNEYDASGNLTATTPPSAGRIEFTYNSSGQPLTSTDALGNVITWTYDSQGNVNTITDAAGSVTRLAYDAVGRVTQTTDPLGRTTTFIYDVLNHLTSATDALGGTTRYTYDPNGNVLTVTTPAGAIITRSYDAINRLVRRVDELGAIDTHDYDPLGNLIRHTDRNGLVSSFAYDALNRRIRSTFGDGTSSEVSYDAAGRVVRAADTNSGAISTERDVLDRTVAQTTATGTITYAYDVLGRRTGMVAPGQEPISYTYDPKGRLVTLAQGAAIATLTYDDLGRRTSLTLPNGLTTDYQYDAASRLTGLIYHTPAGPIGRITYTYDAVGNRTSAAGSLARTPLPDTVAQATYDSGSRQLTFGDRQMAYDLKGNLLSITDPRGTTSLTWDGRNRLVALASPDHTATFTYDAVGRRTGKTIDGVSTTYQYDQLDVVQTVSAESAVAFLRGLAIDEILAISRDGTTLFPAADAIGSTILLTTQTAALQAEYSYGPFGDTQASDSRPSPFQFTGRENDETGLYFYRARYYSPSLHRFVSPDPQRQAVETPYAYASNNPITAADPFGLDTVVIQGGLPSSAPGGSSNSLSSGFSETQQLVAQLQAQGETVVVISNSQDVNGAVNAALVGYQFGNGAVNIIGFSAGGQTAVAAANELNKSNIPVNTLGTIDTFSINPSGPDATIIPPNVRFNPNFFGNRTPIIHGGPNQAVDPSQTEVLNQELPIGHMQMPKDRRVIDTLTDAITKGTMPLGAPK